eukprot:m.9838 g.9838  ORF g.9838 m.9838 type:complete len:547 (+) comp3614_c0_seq2:342-1982(+)
MAPVRGWFGTLLRSAKHSPRTRAIYQMLSGGEDVRRARTPTPEPHQTLLPDAPARCCMSLCEDPPLIRKSNASVMHVTIVIFLEFFAWGLVTTILPDQIRNFFGTSQMWLVLGLTQGLKGFLSFLSAPLLGALSDQYGRKYFLLATVLCTCLPLPFLFIADMWWHVSVVAISGSLAVTFSIVFAYVSDVTLPSERSAAFGQVSATFAASLVLSPALGSFLQRMYGANLVFGLSCFTAVLDIAYIVFFVPESMSCDDDDASSGSGPIELTWERANPFSSMKAVFSSQLMLHLSFMVLLSYLPEAGEYQCLMLFLKSSVDFSEMELAIFIAVLGVMSIIAQTSILSYLSGRLTPKTVICCGLLFQTAQLVIYGLFTAKWVMYAATVFVAMGSITYPAISALVSQSTSAEQQGVVQGVITGIRSLCTGLGPALFGLLFQIAEVPLDGRGSTGFTRHFSTSFPGAPFLVGAGFVLMSLLVTLTLPDRPVRARSQRRTRSVCELGDKTDTEEHIELVPLHSTRPGEAEHQPDLEPVSIDTPAAPVLTSKAL